MSIQQNEEDFSEKKKGNLPTQVVHTWRCVQPMRPLGNRQLLAVHAVKEHSFLRLGLCFFVGAGRLLAFCGFGLPFGPECCPTFLGWGSLVGFPGVKRRFADKSLVVFCGLVTRAVQDWL